MAMAWIILLILCSVLSAVECGSHSLQFLSTGLMQPGVRPKFEQLTVFDGVPISHCDSLTKREELKLTLESKNLPSYCEEAYYNILESLHEFSQIINSTEYVIQRRRGCVLSANGTVSAVEGWAVNGEAFISFDPESQRWTSQSPSAITIRHRWNSNTIRNLAFQNFIREQCPQWIQGIKLTPVLQRTELRVFAKPIVNTAQALLRCHVTTTDKSLRSVQLRNDGGTKVIWTTVVGPVPSEDRSVVLRLTALIALSQDTNTYSCSVQTGGHNITYIWDGNTLDGRYLLNVFHWKRLSLILGLCCIVLVVMVVSCGTILLLKCVRESHHTSTQVVSLAERHREWMYYMESITPEDQNFYDPEYFAHQVDGWLGR